MDTYTYAGAPPLFPLPNPHPTPRDISIFPVLSNLFSPLSDPSQITFDARLPGSNFDSNSNRILNIAGTEGVVDRKSEELADNA